MIYTVTCVLIEEEVPCPHDFSAHRCFGWFEDKYLAMNALGDAAVQSWVYCEQTKRSRATAYALIEGQHPGVNDELGDAGYVEGTLLYRWEGPHEDMRAVYLAAEDGQWPRWVMDWQNFALQIKEG